MGVILSTYIHWDDPPSTSSPIFSANNHSELVTDQLVFPFLEEVSVGSEVPSDIWKSREVGDGDFLCF